MADAEIPREIAAHYEAIDEQDRLEHGDGLLEQARTDNPPDGAD